MSNLILQISDLHLSKLSRAQVTGDYKAANLVPIEEQQNRLELLRNSLTEVWVWLTQRGERLSSVVICGDVALSYDEAGFRSLRETLGHLNSQLPADDHIVVVPGNHDVRWETPPSSAERYELFIKYVRNEGYVTPLIEGIDLIGGQDVSDPPHNPILEDPEFVVFALNSANYCGSLMKFPADVSEGDKSLDDLRALVSGEPGLESVLDHLDSLRRQDIARISEVQLRMLSERLSEISPPADGGPLRIVALHHHLLPVNTSEEFKAFENLTNLGQLRIALAACGVSLVLHGHKHSSASYIDHVTLGDLGSPVAEGQYLVSSGATVWRQDHTSTEFARLIEVERYEKRVRTIQIDSLPYTQSGSRLVDSHQICRWVPAIASDGSEPTLWGSDVDEVYGKVLARLEGLKEEGEIRGLTCIVENGPTALHLPSSFPQLEGVDDLDAWLKDMVSWWQKEDPGLAGRGRRFNHGERIRRYENRINQIDEVIAALKQANGTTRGIIQLIDITRDDIGNAEQRIPSFFSAHFVPNIVTHKLDCIGYFRKQQMRMWWPVNVCELAKLQAEVVAGLGGIFGSGSITTISGIAIAGTNKPRVLVPKIDRLATDEPETLWGMAYELFFGSGDTITSDFLNLFVDWRPGDSVEQDGTAVSLNGLSTIREAVGLFSDRTDSGKGKSLASRLQDLYDVNVNYSDIEETVVNPSDHAVQFARWKEIVERKMIDVQVLVQEIVSERP